VDPSHLSDLVSSLLADGGEVAGIMTDPASMTDVAAAAPVEDNGWFGFLTIPIMGLLQVIHTGVSSVAGSNSWGISIIVLTILIKALTFPLTKTQLESTTRMQAMQPAMKQIQTKYQSNPEVMNQKMAEFYQQNNINPLAGCLPSLLQIPIFIGLYRAVLDLAKENKLNEPFLFLPSLEGPTYGADPATANDWIFKGLYVLFCSLVDLIC
jgi:YidC/Oxa1 family membrane protein insertase